MIQNFCPKCGSPRQARLSTCPTCSEPFGDAMAVDGPKAAPWPWVVAGVAGVLALLALGFLVLQLVGDGDGGEELFAGPDQVTTLAPTSTTTSTSTTTTTTSSPPPPPAAPPPPAPPPAPAPGPVTPPGNPWELMHDWALGLGVNYVGVCEEAISTIDYGPDPWCAELWEDRGTQMLWRLASFPGGDFAIWVLMAGDAGGWFVADTVDDIGSGPPF